MKKNFDQGWKISRDGVCFSDVILPHDAMLEEERRADNPSGSACACFSGGKYIYEKEVNVPLEWREKILYLEFEGVYRNAEVYVNEQKAAYCTYGYRPFWVKLNEYLSYGEINTIRVIADNSKVPNSRWYTGSGIYRSVWLWEKDKYHILPEGVKITTVSTKPAIIRVDTEHTGETVEIEILLNGEIKAKGSGETAEILIPNARLWSDTDPVLYECKVTLKKEGEVTDRIIEKFGIRTLEWSPKGFFVNGKETLLRGGCIHHDHGILGAKCFRTSEFRRVKILKKAGYNAIRSSHNPASKFLLEACDYYGVYVIDETWDMWYHNKNKFDYACDFMENYRDDISAMVKRDYNHPSVIMYSIGNEISEPIEGKGIALEKEMVAFIHELDRSRPVTCGINLMILKNAATGKKIYKDGGGREEQKREIPNSSKMFNIITSKIGTQINNAGNSDEADKVTSPALDALDIAGYNYSSGRYPLEGEAHPNRILFGSETFPQDIWKNWNMVKKYPYLIGDFMWSAWDYIGEAGGGTWGYTEDSNAFEKPYPWILAEMGTFDILGNENAEAGYASVVWGKREQPYLGVQPVNHPGIEPMKSVWRGTNALPSWSWRGCEGNEAIVEVYADAAIAELYLNGKIQDTKEIKEMKALFQVRYEPGILETIVYDESGRTVGKGQLISSDKMIRIGLHPEETKVIIGDIVYIPITLEDVNGIVEMNADLEINAKVEGGRLLGFGSADPRTEESYLSEKCRTYYGRALAVVYADQPGRIKLTVSSASMEDVTTEIAVQD